MRLSEDLQKIADLREDLDDTSGSIDIPPDLDPSVTLQEFAPSPARKDPQEAQNQEFQAEQPATEDMPRKNHQGEDDSFTATSPINTPLPPPPLPPQPKETKKMATKKKAPSSRSSIGSFAVVLALIACAGTGYLYYIQTGIQGKVQTITEEFKKKKAPTVGEIDARIRRYLTLNPEARDEMTTREIEALRRDIELIKASQTALEAETKAVKDEALRTLSEATRIAAKVATPAASLQKKKHSSTLMKKKSRTETKKREKASERNVHWVLNLVSEKEAKNLAEVKDRLTRAGFTPKIKKVAVKGTTWYRLILAGFSSPETVLKKKKEITRTFGIHSAWIERQ